MAWRNCVASIKLGQEIAQTWPNRDNLSDGTIGDAAHQSRNSDHNPWVVVNGVGVVRARDIDEDLDGNKADSGRDADSLFQHLLKLAKGGDNRITGGGYLIYESKIYSERQNWAARPYTGTANMHTKHIHISFSRNIAGFDSDRPWGLVGGSTSSTNSGIMKRGGKGLGVAFLADMANIMAFGGGAIGANGKPNKNPIPVPKDQAARTQFVYGPQVEERVREIQRFGHAMWLLNGKRGKDIAVDGIFGPQTAGLIAFWVPIVLSK